MVEYDRTQERELAASPRIKICVAGIGGGGLNVLDRISLDRMMDATLVSMHTDVRVLSHSMSSSKIQLGAETMRGIGSGGDPELGREAAESSREQIKAALQGHEMVFICCGLGGGTGSGAAPVVAEIAKELGALVFVFATMPFNFEGRRRLMQAEVALDDLQNTADALILFENSRMGELILPKEGIQKAFSQADQLIGHSVRAISSIVTQPGIVRMGMADLLAALRSPNARCLFGFGEARGTSRVADALKRALKSPLVNQGLLLQSARNLLVHVTGGESLTLAEVESLMKQLGKYVPEETQIMFGLSVEPRMGDSLCVTLISSLSAQEMSLDASTEIVAKRVDARALEAPRAEVKAPVVEETSPELPKTEKAPVVDKVKPAAAPVAAPAEPAAAAPEESVGELFPVEPASQPAAVPAAAPVAAAPVVTAAPEPAPAPAPEPTPVAEAPEAVVETVAPAPAPAPAPVSIVANQIVVASKTPVAAPEPAIAEVVAEMPAAAPVVDPAPVVQEAASVAAVSPPAPAAAAEVEVEEEEEVVEAPVSRHVELPAAPVFKSSFTVLQDDEDEEEEESEEPGAHWADKYTSSASQPANAGSRHELEPALAHAGPGTLSDFKQSTFNLAQEEVTRFKGTDKTIVEGEDLDVPTWMRLRQKSKR